MTALYLLSLVGILAYKNISERTGWVAGFYENMGYFHLNRSTLQCSITLAQKDLLLLQEISAVLPGTMYYNKSWDGSIVVPEERSKKNKKPTPPYKYVFIFKTLLSL